MLNLKDDNNDDLFRRAADNYPVKTDSSDWEAVRAKMDAAAYEPQTEVADKRKRYRLLWLLLLLIPLTILETKYKFIDKQFTADKKEATTTRDEPKLTDQSFKTTTASVEKNAAGPTNEPVAIVANGSSNSTSSTQKNTATINNNTNEPGNINNKPVSNNGSTADDHLNLVNKQSRHSNQHASIKIKNALATADDADNNGNKKHTVKSDKRKQHITMKAGETGSDDAALTTTKTNTGNEVAGNKNEKEVVKEEKVVNTGEEKNTIAETGKKIEAEKVTDKKDSATDKKITKEIAKTETKVSKKEDKRDKRPNKHFYIGLMAGPDFSMIKLQSVKKTGINYGFLAGYKINKRFSVETGIYKDKKFYSSKGQYFSTKNIYLPPNATIEYVDGECNMLEVPINFTYSFRQRTKSAWFASAGVSSYFMKDESYVYDILHNGYRYPYSYKYKNKNTALLAVVNLSAGYTYKLGKIADLRIEPYLKLPVNKVGTGKLPIQSFGLMVGVTKTIF